MIKVKTVETIYTVYTLHDEDEEKVKEYLAQHPDETVEGAVRELYYEDIWLDDETSTIDSSTDWEIVDVWEKDAPFEVKDKDEEDDNNEQET